MVGGILCTTVPHHASPVGPSCILRSHRFLYLAPDLTNSLHTGYLELPIDIHTIGIRCEIQLQQGEWRMEEVDTLYLLTRTNRENLLIDTLAKQIQEMDVVF